MAGSFVTYPIVRFSLCLATGIVLAKCVDLARAIPIACLASSLLLLIVFWFAARKQLRQNIYFGLCAHLCFFSLGWFNYELHQPDWNKHHFEHVLPQDTERTMLMKIDEVLKPSSYSSNYIGTVLQVDSVRTSGRILLGISKNSTTSGFSTDDVLVLSTQPKPLSPPLNPYGFDYSAYLATQSVYHTARVTPGEILISHRGTTTLKGLASRIRDRLIRSLKKTTIDDKQRAILQALVLGEKREIDRETYQDYADAGAVHILAVSGLHVGILFLFLDFLLRPLKRFRRGALQAVLIVCCLYMFAVLTGWGPSVVRAATMFSLFALAKLLRRPTPGINTLFLSFFILLVCNPNWLFQIGFQMSYMAVLAILLLHPKLSNLWNPRWSLLKKFRDIVTVSLSAQLGVLPLSLFYFHQFPCLFLLTNIVVLPFIGMLLIGGIIIVFLASMNLLPDFLAQGYDLLLGSLNAFIAWIASFDEWVLSDIPFTLPFLIASYVLLGALLNFWYNPEGRRLWMVSTALVVGVGVLIGNKWQYGPNEFLVFHKSRETLLGYKNNNQLTILKRSDRNYSNDRTIRDYVLGSQSVSVSETRLPSIFAYSDTRIMVIDSSGVYPPESRAKIVLLIESPKVHLERLIDSLRPSVIIADGSNYRSYVTRWRETCKKRKLPFHHTGTQGAYYIE